MNKTQKIETSMELLRILAGLAIAYGTALVILLAISDDPVNIIRLFVTGPFSSARRIGSLINLAVPFTLCGLAMCFMYAVNKFNLVVEGIFMLSACTVSWASISLSSMNLPVIVMMPILLVVAVLTGVVVSFVPAILDRKFQANVVVVSLMLNSVIAYLCTWILRYQIKDSAIAFIGSKEIPVSARMPSIFGKFRIQAGVWVAIICIVVIAILFYKTSFGWKMRMVGSNPNFAKAVGLSVVGTSFAAQLIGGGVAGIAGATEMMGNYTRFQWTNTTGHGFDGLLVAVLAKKNPALVPIAALFLAYIRIGADVVNTTGDIPTEFVSIIQGIIILLVAAESFLSGIKHKMIFKEAEKGLKNKETAAKASA